MYTYYHIAFHFSDTVDRGVSRNPIGSNQRLIANRIWRRFDRLSRLDKHSVRPFKFWGRFLKSSCQPKFGTNYSEEFIISDLQKKKDKLRNLLLFHTSKGRMNEEETILELLTALYFGEEQVTHLN
jgi:hypothetical protein